MTYTSKAYRLSFHSSYRVRHTDLRGEPPIVRVFRAWPGTADAQLSVMAMARGCSKVSGGPSSRRLLPQSSRLRGEVDSEEGRV